MSYDRQPCQRTEKQALAMMAARNNQLYEISGKLVLRTPGLRDQPVKSFSPAIVGACVGRGWLMRHDHGQGVIRITTTIAGDAEMRRPFQPTFRRLQRLRDSERRGGL